MKIAFNGRKTEPIQQQDQVTADDHEDQRRHDARRDPVDRVDRRPAEAADRDIETRQLNRPDVAYQSFQGRTLAVGHDLDQGVVAQDRLSDHRLQRRQQRSQVAVVEHPS